MMDAETLQLLRALAQQVRAGDQGAQLRAIERIGLERLFDVETIVCALGAGGVGLAGFIADLATEHAAEPGRYRKILEICDAAPARPDGAEIAREIITAFGVDDAEAFFRNLQRELARASQAPADRVNAALAEMKRGDWATALAEFTRLLAEQKEATPRPVYAHAATCLHKLGKYAEAEEMNLQGLGSQRELIAVKSEPPAEAELVRGWTQNPEPVVSIVCMTYNQERYIEGAIRGFLTQQTKFSFEILIHDDASSDDTAAKIRGWQAKYPTIIRAVLQTKNQFSRGVRPFELLLKQARGRYVAICEGDDYWLDPTKLQKQIGFLEAHPDFSCAAHNYYLYNESLLSVTRWNSTNVDRVLTPQHLMNVTRLLWLPTLVFRKTFSTLPREREFAALGDQFLTSYLGTLGKGAYFETLLGAVRRENQYSIWTPASAAKKEHARVKTWAALVRFHESRGNHEAAAHHTRRIQASTLPADQKAALLAQSLAFQTAAIAEPVA